mmetsp:Transcript_103916/g.291008  ORF Transcript_103916/g.291008 Transcript_103916/m.291008 type:complete len:228 (-) Transcript_103916:548-1231(-)
MWRRLLHELVFPRGALSHFADRCDHGLHAPSGLAELDRLAPLLPVLRLQGARLQGAGERRAARQLGRRAPRRGRLGNALAARRRGRRAHRLRLAGGPGGGTPPVAAPPRVRAGARHAHVGGVPARGRGDGHFLRDVRLHRAAALARHLRHEGSLVPVRRAAGRVLRRARGAGPISDAALVDGGQRGEGKGHDAEHPGLAAPVRVRGRLVQNRCGLVGGADRGRAETH